MLVPIYPMKSLRALLNTGVAATTAQMPKSEQNLWDKYRIIRKYNCLFSYLFTLVRKAYIFYPGFQSLGCKCLLLGNASWCIEGVMMSLQRSVHLALKPSRELLEVLNDPTVLVSDAGTGWALSLDSGQVRH